MKVRFVLKPAILLLVFLLVALSACSAPGSQSAEQSPVDQAAAEATTMIQQAEATALLLQAQTKATAIMALALSGTPVPSQPIPTSAVLPSIRTVQAPALQSTQLAIYPSGTPTTVPGVQLISVGFAAESGFIFVRFRAPAKEAAKWWQGSISVTDEDNGMIYSEIPVMPVIGPLITRPRQDGQAGYVMLVNMSPGLLSGARVTVVLGDHIFEHVPVE